MSTLATETKSYEERANAKTPPFLPVKKGDVVRWFAPGGGREHVAFVHRLNGDGTLCLAVIPEGDGTNVGVLDISRVCVTHRREKSPATERFRRYGTWDLTESEIERRAEWADMQERLKALESGTKTKRT